MNREAMRFIKEHGYYPFPQIIQLEITKACPFSCKQCYKSESGQVHMDYKKLISFLQNIHGKCPEIALNGGEPMIYPHIIDLLQKIKIMGFNAYLYSSGYGVDREVCSLIDDNRNLHFYISLNGSTTEINSQSRQGYEYAIKAITTMTEQNVDFGIVWVARHDNIKDFVNVIDLATYYDISYISVISNRLTGQGVIDSPLTKDDLTHLATTIREKSLKKPYIVVDNCFSDLIVELGDFIKGLPMKCVAGINRCMVNYDFSFQPCTHLKYSEKFDDIEEYWEKSKVLKKIRTHNFKESGLCENCKNNKKCNPCRATNINIYTNLDAYMSECINFSSDRHI